MLQFLLSLSLLLPHGDLSVRISEKTTEIQLDSTNLLLYMQRGELYAQHEQPDSALIDYQYAVQNGFDSSTVFVLMAEAHLALNEYDEGLKSVKRFLLNEPGHLKGIYTRARIHEAKGDLEEALQDFVLVIQKAETARPQDYVHLANLHLKIDSTQINSAIATLQLGVKKFGPIISLQLKKYDIYKRAKDYEAAHLVLDQILQSLNRKERILVEKAELYMMENKQRDAASMLTKADNAIALLPVRFQNVPATKKLKQRIEELKSRL